MRSHFRDSEGDVIRFAHAGSRGSAGDDVERLEEWAARRAAEELGDDDLVRVWSEHAPDAAMSGEPPSEAELRRWLDDELTGVTARLELWRIERPIRATSAESAIADAPMLSELIPPIPPPTWIAFKVVDVEGEPVANVGYELTLADGSVLDGTTDARGCVRHDGIISGTCELRFRSLPDRQPARSA